MYCEKCGAALEKDDKFCEKCGTEASQGETAKQRVGYRCEICLREYPNRVDGLVGCPKCQTSLKQTPIDADGNSIDVPASNNLESIPIAELSYDERQKLIAKGYVKQGDRMVHPRSQKSQHSGSIANNEVVDRLEMAGKFIVGVGIVSAILTFFVVTVEAGGLTGLGFIAGLVVAAIVMVCSLIAAVTYFAFAEIVQRLQSIDSALQSIKSKK